MRADTRMVHYSMEAHGKGDSRNSVRSTATHLPTVNNRAAAAVGWLCPRELQESKLTVQLTVYAQKTHEITRAAVQLLLQTVEVLLDGRTQCRACRGCEVEECVHQLEGGELHGALGRQPLPDHIPCPGLGGVCSCSSTTAAER